MSTYLLTWKAKYFSFEHLQLLAKRPAKHRTAIATDWHCGNRKNIEVGNRVFMLRQGLIHPGIVAAGWVSKRPFWAPSWDAAKRARGLKSLFVLVEWESGVLPEYCLTKQTLLSGILPSNLLKAAASGSEVLPEFREKLETAWAFHCKIPLKTSTTVLSAASALEGEPAESKGYRHHRDQRLRRAALDASVGVCAACGVDFNQVLGGKGRRVLQIHHKRQLSELDQPKINTVKELAVVCADWA